MNPNEYQSIALTKMAPQEVVHERVSGYGPYATQLNNGQRGLCEEAGEVAKVCKRHLEYGKPLDKDALIDEVGDVLWRAAQVLNAVGATLEEAMAKNLAKLGCIDGVTGRYTGGFTFDKAQDENRDRVAEAKAQLGTESAKAEQYVKEHGNLPLVAEHVKADYDVKK